ncbi:uncharacterized protein LOC114524364 [Dendronephthya gigantea]|uniref:uncharacterized protein LOC114524364 n=1 Tax=Dendronephthya gigantea TaxID=151771 RepID=UPI00106CA18D|nr:uncharacterized protein LOC114524364 [Dendronephthya gigantea]
MMFRQQNRWRIAVGFCLLILLDEFCVKTERLSVGSDNQDGHLNLGKSPVIFVDNQENVVDDFYQSNTTSDLSTRREKRGVIVAILIGASIAASLANLGFDIYLHIKGCCGVYPSACRYRDEFDRLKKTLSTKSRKVDNMWTSAENTKEWVKQCNTQNRELWLEIDRIADVEEELVEALNINLIIAFNNKSAELKSKIRDKNETVLRLTAEQLSVEYDSPFNSIEGTLLIVGGVVGQVGSTLISRAYKSYKINKMSNFLKTSEGSRLINAKPTAQKFFGVSKTNINSHFKATAKAQYKSNFKPIRGKIATGAAAVLAVISIGLEIYSAVMKVKACQSIRDNAHDAVKNMRKANRDMDGMLGNVRQYQRRVSVEGWNKIRSELNKKDLAEILKQLRTLAQGAATQSQGMKNAVTAINNFLSKIRHANYQATFDLQRELIKGLAGLKYTLACYRNVIQATSYMMQHCKNGDGQFSELWDQTVTHFRLDSRSCNDEQGVPYVTKAKMQKAIEDLAKKDKFHPDCILNSKDVRYLVCARKYRGHTASDIAKEFDLTVKQAEIIMPHCPPEPLTPHKINSICRLHKDGMEIIEIVAFMKIEFLKVAGVLIKNCTHTQEPTV